MINRGLACDRHVVVGGYEKLVSSIISKPKSLVRDNQIVRYLVHALTVY